MKKVIFLLTISTFALLLAGCGGDQSGIAVQYLEALNDRDLETARSLVCEARQDDVTMGLTTVDDPDVEPFEFQNISCSDRGGAVSCSYTINQQTEGVGNTGVQRTAEVVFDFEGDKVCGFDEEVAQ